MSARNTFATIALALAFSSSAFGAASCYDNNYNKVFNPDGSNFKFGHLYNSPTNYFNEETQSVDVELKESIIRMCTDTNGAKVPPKTWKRGCEEWPYMAKSDDCLYVQCMGECKGKEDCVEPCQAKCPMVQHDVNNLVIELAHGGGGSDTRTMTYDVCYKGLYDVYNGCSDYGGFTTQDGFFFRLDPNPNSCSYIKDPTMIKLIGKGKAPKGKGAVKRSFAA